MQKKTVEQPEEQTVEQAEKHTVGQVEEQAEEQQVSRHHPQINHHLTMEEPEVGEYFEDRDGLKSWNLPNQLTLSNPRTFTEMQVKIGYLVGVGSGLYRRSPGEVSEVRMNH
jgi:hypothetical protein